MNEEKIERIEKKIDLWFKMFLNSYGVYGSDATYYPFEECFDEFLEIYNIDKKDLYIDKSKAILIDDKKPEFNQLYDALKKLEQFKIEKSRVKELKKQIEKTNIK